MPGTDAGVILALTQSGFTPKEIWSAAELRFLLLAAFRNLLAVDAERAHWYKAFAALDDRLDDMVARAMVAGAEARAAPG